MNEVLKLPVNILGGVNFKKLFENYLDGQKMVSMCDWPEYGGAYPFHQMTNNGMLGSHVDHSHSQSGDLHVANSIYYVSLTFFFASMIGLIIYGIFSRYNIFLPVISFNYARLSIDLIIFRNNNSFNSWNFL